MGQNEMVMLRTMVKVGSLCGLTVDIDGVVGYGSEGNGGDSMKANRPIDGNCIQ